jgi:hypothetical protein
MNYLKYTQYVYLVATFFFIYDGISKMQSDTSTPWLSFIIAGVSLFMFFFRRKFAKKFENRSNQK